VLGPATGIEVLDSVLFQAQRLVRVPTKHPLRIAGSCVRQSAFGDFGSQTQPFCIQPFQQPGCALARIELLQPQKQGRQSPGKHNVIEGEAIKLMPVDSQVPNALEAPLVFLVNLDPDQVGHYFGKPLVVVAFYPDDFHVTSGIGKLADVRKELPVLFLKAPEIQIAKNVAQEDEPAKGSFFQHCQRGFGTAYFRTQVQIGKNHRVETRSIHAFCIPKSCYSSMNLGSKTSLGTIFSNSAN
jgi:hypothetical protein